MKPKAALSLAFLVLLGLSSLSDATDAELSKSEHHHHHHDHQDHDQKVSISDDSDGGENGGDNGHHHHHHNQEEAGLNKGGEEHHHHHHHHDGDNKNGGEEHHHHHHHHDGDKKDGGEEHHHHHHHHDPDEVDSNKNGEHSSHHHHHHHHKDDDNEHHHHHQQHHHHDQNPKSCKHDIVPGSHTMQHGVDLNALDFFPMGEKSSDQANGILDAVFSFSCDPADPRTWKNPDEHRDRHGHHVHYSLPVDFQDVRPVPTGNKDFTVDISTSVHEVKESLELRASVSATFKGVGFSASGGYKTSKENMLKESKSVALTESHQSAYEIELKDRITLSEKFRHAVEKLPDDFGHHQSHYTEFIQQFGTHYFSVGRFGGSMVIRTEFDSSYVSSTSKHEIEQKIGVSVPLVAKGSISVSAGEQQVDQQFNSKSSSSLHYFGGSANLNSENALNEWHKSVAKNPWLFSGKLEPLDKAVGAHHSLKAKAEQIGKAIKVYLARASLVDLEETMTWKPEIKAKIEGDEANKKKLEKVKRFFDEETHHFHGKDIRKNIKRLTELLDVAHKG